MANELKRFKTELLPVSKIKNNPNNPRVIKDDKFRKLVKSIKEFPEMMEIRPIVVNDELIALGGNMRLKACKEAGLTEVPVIKAKNLTEGQQREFIIKDNVGFGEWDWDEIANKWDNEELIDWGLDLPGFDVDQSTKEEGCDMNNITFKLSTEQLPTVENAIWEMAQSEENNHAETTGNDDKNGNALYALITNWNKLRKQS